MTEILISAALFIFLAGLWLGKWAEAKRWERKGNHEYMNTIASGGALYIVKREQN